MCGATVLVLVGGVAALPEKQTQSNQVSQLIKQLGDDEFAKREAASHALAKVGEPALAALRKAAAASEDAEVRLRARRLIARIENAVPHLRDTRTFFNGKDLTGWEGLPGYWQVKDGAIVGAPPAGRTTHTFLCSTKTYRDFELKFKVRRKDGVGNSGVQFRSTLANRPGFGVIGPQCEIAEADHSFPPGSLLTEPDCRPLAVKAPKAKGYKDADFNEFQIRCVGKQVVIKVNGVTTVNDKFASLPGEGIIAWQLHGSLSPKEVTFKDISFTNLSPGKD
jgi:hypothetical protein